MNLCIKVCFIVMITAAAAHGRAAGPLIIGIDTSNWYPNTFVDDGMAKGRDVDLTIHALKQIGYKFTFKLYPWKRCLSNLQKGEINALISASYSDSRARYAHYPPGAENGSEKDGCLSHVDYHLIGSADSLFRYNGDPSSIIDVVAVPLGYSVGKDLERFGVRTKYFRNIDLCFKYVVSTKNSLTITTLENAQAITQELSTVKPLIIHPYPVVDKSYYLIFSKKNPGLPREMMIQLWKTIQEQRDDSTYYNTLIKAYPPLPVSQK